MLTGMRVYKLVVSCEALCGKTTNRKLSILHLQLTNHPVLPLLGWSSKNGGKFEMAITQCSGWGERQVCVCAILSLTHRT